MRRVKQQRPGNLRHVIKIVRKVQTDDGQGGFTEAWTTAFTCRAEVRTSGKEIFNQDSNATHVSTTTMFTIRNLTNYIPTETDRIQYAGNTYEITFVPPSTTDLYVVINATRIAE